MTLIFCIENDGGMLFGGRRVSRDARVCERIMMLCGDDTLYCSTYSEKLFEGMKANARFSDDFLINRGKNDFCFCEKENVAEYLGEAKKVIIYNFNRDYPADKRFDLSLLDTFTVGSVYEFEGSSHEKITETIYMK